MLGVDDFALIPWLVTLQQKTTHKERENSKLQKQISRSTGVMENALGVLESRFRVQLGTMEQRPKVVRDIL